MTPQLTDIAPLRPLIQRSPLGLISDIDGTLAPIVPDPEDARVTDRARELLSALAGSGVRLAFVTGRALDVARAMVDVPGAAFAANHGLDVWVDGVLEGPESGEVWTARARQALGEIGALGVAGVIVEEKGTGLAFHYRNATAEGAARRSILTAIEGSAAARAFRLQEGRKVIELRPRVAADKGTAVSRLAERLGLAALICIGDDVTDLDMFRAVGELRQRGAPGVSIAVANAEAPESVRESADYWVDGVPGVEWLLGELVRAGPAKSR